MTDVVVVGGGPAGLTAALGLARAGCAVALLEEQPTLGGQYFRRVSPQVVARYGDHRPAGSRLIEAVYAAGVDVHVDTAVWGIDDDGRSLLTVRQGVAARHSSDTIVLTTGAYERVLPFPGWQLPGVTTPGFAQHLAGDHVAVGRRVVIAGSGPFLLPVAAALSRLGVKVVGVAEAGRPYRITLPSLAAARYPDRLLELSGYVATLARHRVPIWQGRAVSAASPGPDGRVASVTLARTAAPGEPIVTHEVDALCVGYGFRPQIELARLLGCRVRRDTVSGDLVPVVDEFGRAADPTSVAVWIAGEAAGIGGVHAAIAEGELVAARIVESFSRSKASRAASRRQRRFAQLTERLYPAPAALAIRLTAALPASTQICRCEAVTAGAIRAAAVWVDDRGALKAFTRAGMGPCQGRACAAAVAALSGVTGPETVRMPVRPVGVEAVPQLSREKYSSFDSESTAAASSS